MTRRVTAQSALISTAILLFLAIAFLNHDASISLNSHFRALTKSQPGSDVQTFRRSHVVVASRFASHFDVYLAFVWTLQRVLGERGHVSVYADQPYRFGFPEIVDRLGLYNGTYHHPNNLIADVNSTSMYAGELDAMIDMVVFGTCEIDMRRWSDELLQAYDARPPMKKFQLVCIVHNIRDTAWQTHITPWARRGAIRILPISEHVAEAFRTKFSGLADSPEFGGSGYEYIPVNVHVPILSISDPKEKDPSAILSKAVIQGSLAGDRRDYKQIFADLQHTLEENPTPWGYKPLASSTAAYEVDPSSQHTPFVLHLVGQGDIEVPHNISNLIQIHTRIDYSVFYDLMHDMDVVIPAFAPRGGYFDSQASSTMVMAVECNVPVLVTDRIRAAYKYVSDDRITVTRPQAIREIHAIKMLRAGVLSPSPDLSGNAVFQFEQEGQRMLEQGWHRTNRGFTAVKQRIWLANEGVVRNILNDMS